ncbi:MAG: hypothetical protein ACI4SS_03135 [Clostridia bacterium]
MKAFVIAVSGVSGSGKTAVCQELLRKIEHSALVRFEDYAGPCPMDYKWLTNGGDFNSIDLKNMRAEVERLSGGSGYECVILDYPLGRCNDEMNPVIDFVFYIETSPDIALARRLALDLKRGREDKIAEKLRLYRQFGFAVNRKIAEAVRHGADVSVNGDADIDTVAGTVVEFTKCLIRNSYIFPEKKSAAKPRRDRLSSKNL